MLPLSMPIAGGTLGELRRFVNLPTSDDGDDTLWINTVAWLIAAFRAHGPYPVLVVLGEHGSAKSTLARVLRELIDPNKAAIRSMQRDERDLMIAATNGWILAYDNLSYLQPWQSDALCRISTGGGFAARELYSDQDETILDVQRPVILNGIEDIATRSDLLSRAITVYLPSIPKAQRQAEKQFWREFEQARPSILGAILDAVSTALANEATVALEEHPRMADFAEWIVAAEPALPWKEGGFLTAYLGNQHDANALALEVSPVSQAVRDLMKECQERWEGTATELLNELEDIADDRTKRQKSWPGSAQSLSNKLRRLAPNLRAVGIDVLFDERKHGGTRMIRIKRQAEQEGASPSPVSPSSPVQSSSDGDGSGGDDVMQDADDLSVAPWEQPCSDLWGDPDSGDDGDAGDASFPPYSEGALDRVPCRECLECGRALPADGTGFYCDRHGGQAR
jgi:hypothetical protein